MRLVLKILFLFCGALVFFLLFPLFQRSIGFGFAVFCGLLAAAGAVYRTISGRREFRLTLLLWLSGSAVYGVIALILALKHVQPLPYASMGPAAMTFYYAGYPLRVLGVFFVGMIFVHITSPAEFLSWGKLGLKVALAYRAFEYSVHAFEETRRALVMQGYWPDPTSKGRGGLRNFRAMIGSSFVLIATTFRNIILWFPWAWICYNSLLKDFSERTRKEG